MELRGLRAAPTSGTGRAGLNVQQALRSRELSGIFWLETSNLFQLGGASRVGATIELHTFELLADAEFEIKPICQSVGRGGDMQDIIAESSCACPGH